jgi:hypothetical protein
MRIQQNQIPLGVTGMVTMSKDRVASLAELANHGPPPAFLLADDQRLAWPDDALSGSLTTP